VTSSFKLYYYQIYHYYKHIIFLLCSRISKHQIYNAILTVIEWDTYPCPILLNLVYIILSFLISQIRTIWAVSRMLNPRVIISIPFRQSNITIETAYHILRTYILYYQAIYLHFSSNIVQSLSVEKSEICLSAITDIYFILS